MKGSVPVKVRRERANILIDIARELEQAFAMQFIGTRQDVLFEQKQGTALWKDIRTVTCAYMPVHRKAH